MIWVSSYFDVAHSLEITEPELALRSNNYLDITDPTRTPTCKRFTDQELGEITHPAVMTRAPDVRWAVPQNLWWEMTQRALVKSGGLWPAMRVVLLWCDMTTPDIVWSMKMTRDRLHAGQEIGQKTRQTEVVRIRGGNHFVRGPALLL